MQLKLTAAAGIALICVAVLGFFTFADDLRHFGELSVATGLVLSGLSFTLVALRPKISTLFALQWFTPFILAGLVIGAMADATLIGLAAAVPVGLLVSRLLRNRPQSTTCATISPLAESSGSMPVM